jgi:hypothetical protein
MTGPDKSKLDGVESLAEVTNEAKVRTALSAVNVEVILATVAGVDWNVGTKTTLYTVPGGKSAVISRVVIRNASSAVTTASVGFGFNAGADDWIIPLTFAGLTTSGKVAVLIAGQGVIDAGELGTAGQIFGCQADILEGSAQTVTIDVIGYLV